MQGAHTKLLFRHDEYVEVCLWRGRWHYRRSVPYDCLCLQ